MFLCRLCFEGNASLGFKRWEHGSEITLQVLTGEKQEFGNSKLLFKVSELHKNKSNATEECLLRLTLLCIVTETNGLVYFLYLMLHPMATV